MLLDSGDGRKLEQFGPFRLDRPAASAVWAPRLSPSEWKRADARFLREEERWKMKTPLPSSWETEIEGIIFKLKPTAFGHLGVFPEQAPLWSWIRTKIQMSRKKISLLNLFAYTGGASLAAAQAGASVTHVDAAKGMLVWGKENAALNRLEKAPIRYVIEDARKFLVKELRRGAKYDAVVLDPPSFGRGKQGEVFKIETDLGKLLDDVRALLSPSPLFLLLSSHTPGYTPIVLKQLLQERFENKGALSAEEMVLSSAKAEFVLPSGTYARWEA